MKHTTCHLPLKKDPMLRSAPLATIGLLLTGLCLPASLNGAGASPRGPVASTWHEAFARMTPWRPTPATPSLHLQNFPNAAARRLANVADPATMNGKVMTGYQGWFATPGDGSGMGWVHYGGRDFGPGKLGFEAWPDMSELPPAERCPTPFRNADGSVAELFSSYNPATVDRHFYWMRRYGIDGAFLQRFVAYLRNPGIHDFRTAVTDAVRDAANRHGRTWAMMYDLSGWRADEKDFQMVVDDWKRLVDRMAITRDPAYQRHNGKPLVALWGVGFPGRAYNHHLPRLVDFLKNDPVYGGNAIMLGTTYGWRDGTRDAKPDAALLDLCARADIVSPWSVGRYGSLPDFQKNLSRRQQADLAWCSEKNVDYLPVIFPGFSWQNLMRRRGKDPGREIPRGDGSFFWTQGRDLVASGARMIYVAMFDEVDEGTAIFKISPAPPPSGDHWITNSPNLPDHMLWLAGQLRTLLASRIQNPDTPLPAVMPARPLLRAEHDGLQSHTKPQREEGKR
ncbi:MAG: hypothetical protein LBS59_00820 [Puniceicoccales bacterium]|jgi:hypothetical protein|nr:hypothetical protein [Puniceicoccales bacterium]